MLARYFDPKHHRQLPLSTGVERIRVAIANRCATRATRDENSIVLMREVPHTIGATETKTGCAADRRFICTVTTNRNGSRCRPSA